MENVFQSKNFNCGKSLAFWNLFSFFSQKNVLGYRFELLGSFLLIFSWPFAFNSQSDKKKDNKALQFQTVHCRVPCASWQPMLTHLWWIICHMSPHIIQQYPPFITLSSFLPKKQKKILSSSSHRKYYSPFVGIVLISNLPLKFQSCPGENSLQETSHLTF